jgi:hypothetical protein
VSESGADGRDQPELGLDDEVVRDRLARVERKPPLYRAFRWSLYGIYVMVAAWLVLSITVAIWKSVYGEAGAARRAAETAPQ